MSALQPIALQPMALGRDHGVSGLERACAQLSLVPGPEPMPADGEEISYDAVHRQEALAWGLDLKPRIPCSRWRVGWWETSARLLA